MRVCRVRIENFRSIKEVDFTPGTYCVLIGENNAGKSNILRALNLILGESWPSERSFSDEDFHDQDTTKDIVIQVYFDEVIPQNQNGLAMEVAGFQLCCKAYKKRTGSKAQGTLHTDYNCINRDGKVLKFPPQPFKKGEKPSGYWPDLRVSAALREQIPLIYIDVLREYDRQNPGNRWSVLRKLFNEVNTEFLTSKEQITVTLPDGSKRKMTRKEAFEQSVTEAYQFLRTSSFQEIEKKLAENVIEQMGIGSGEGEILLRFATHDPTHVFKTLQLYVEQLGITSPAGEVGAGLQSAIVVGIFRTYEQFKREGALFAIEEPEVFLHPQKARYFESVLQSIADSGNQVILTTHSPVFVRIHQPESVIIIRRNIARGTWTTQTTKVAIAEDDRRALRLLTEFDAQRNELFFARKVLLVEGATEKIALPLALKALGHDINQLGISVVECGGKTKLPLFVKVAKALEIPYIVLADTDIRVIPAEADDKKRKAIEEDNRKHERWNKDLEDTTDSGHLFWMTPSFEHELGLPMKESDKLDRALEKFAVITKSDLPTSLIAPIEALMKL
ncbi:MAG TPA: AAA family ATPase [Gemmatimonadaceae bacterium]|nr:AAA family ATPase [Gemmatimonadaceae bacterium]